MSIVVLDQSTWHQLEQVQTVTNQKVRYEADMQRFGVQDFWEPAITAGDCEDIALTKRNWLIEMGWPAEKLRIATAIDERGELHAVLTVDVVTEDGRPGTYVLDNRFARVEPWQVLSQYGYAWIARAHPGEQGWVAIGDRPSARVTAFAAAASASIGTGAAPTASEGPEG